MSLDFKSKVKGCLFLTMVIIIWVGSAELIQIIFRSSGTDFNQPLFLTYYSTSFFTIYLIPLVYEYGKLKF